MLSIPAVEKAKSRRRRRGGRRRKKSSPAENSAEAINGSPANDQPQVTAVEPIPKHNDEEDKPAAKKSRRRRPRRSRKKAAKNSPEIDEQPSEQDPFAY